MNLRNLLLLFHFLILTAWSILGDIILEEEDAHRKLRIYSVAASFGQPIPDDGILGRIIEARPLNACDPIDPPPLRNNTEPVWIAIIVRYGNCNFQEKITHATESNFSAAIVFNVDNNHTVPMGGQGDNLIPSVFIGSSDGKRILGNYTFKKNPKIRAILYPDEPFDLNAYLLPFAIVLGICFLIMLGIVIFKCVQDHRRNRRHRLPKSALKKLPIVKYNPDESPYDTCCICLEDYVENDKLRILPCDHAYHKSCIDPWLVKNKRVCPQCRKKVFSRESGDNDDTSGAEDEDDVVEAGNNEVAPLLSNVRSRGGTGGTFVAGGSYAAAVAGQMAASQYRRRMNFFTRFRRPEYVVDDSVEDNPDHSHVAIIHSENQREDEEDEEEEESEPSFEVAVNDPSSQDRYSSSSSSSLSSSSSQRL